MREQRSLKGLEPCPVSKLPKRGAVEKLSGREHPGVLGGGGELRDHEKLLELCEQISAMWNGFAIAIASFPHARSVPLVDANLVSCIRGLTQAP